jgi:hypothetical protein
MSPAHCAIFSGVMTGGLDLSASRKNDAGPYFL